MLSFLTNPTLPLFKFNSALMPDEEMVISQDETAVYHSSVSTHSDRTAEAGTLYENPS